MKPWQIELASIDNWMARADNEDREALWDILAALRGPDDSDFAAKIGGAAVIRSKALPLTFANVEESMDSSWSRGVAVNPTGIISINEPSHYARHIKRAAEHLGLLPKSTRNGPSIK